MLHALCQFQLNHLTIQRINDLTITNHLITEYTDMERRKFTRFRAQDDAFAALRGKNTKVGKIRDISLKGLAFRYLSEMESSETFNHVDIFLSGNGFHLFDVPCKVVCDQKECVLRDSPMITPYRCGLKFEGLNEEYESQLEYFIKNYTTGVLK